MRRRALLLMGVVATLGCAAPEPASELGLPSWCPLPVGSDAVVDVSIDWSFSLALLADGSVWCWGENVGRVCPHSEDFILALAPVRADLLGCLTQIHVEGGLAIGRHASGIWLAWGDALADHVPGGRDARVVRLDVGDDVVQVQSLAGPFMTLDAQGRVFWHDQGLRRQVPLSRPATFVERGTFRPCALLEGGTVACLPKGPADWSQWVETDLDEVPKQLGVGNSAVCALSEAGAVSCWGENHRGELGFADPPGVRTETFTPMTVEGLPAVTELFPGDDMICALETSENGERAAWCWGDAPDGKLGSTLAEQPLRTVLERPIRVEPFRDVQKVFAGTYHACVLREDRSLYCAGPAGYPGTCEPPPFTWRRVVFEEGTCR